MVKTKDLINMKVMEILSYPMSERNWLRTSVVRLRGKGYGFITKTEKDSVIVIKTENKQDGKIKTDDDGK